ncbi:MAG: DUF1499 domain-containing protein [Methylococcaceae bacterium]
MLKRLIPKTKYKFKLYCTYVFLFAFIVNAYAAEEMPLTMKLTPCPNSPNCVSSQSKSAFSQISPLSYKMSEIQAIDKIKKIMLEMPRTTLIKETDQYLHIEYRTAILKFVDDVEIIINDTEKVIHLRSASRLGFWDIGANKRRINGIKKKFRE